MSADNVANNDVNNVENNIENNIENNVENNLMSFKLPQDIGIKVIGGSTLLARKALLPYSDEAINFLNELSATLLRDIDARQFADVIAFAYWCRGAHLKSLRDEWQATQPTQQMQSAKATGQMQARIGRGLVLHIAPGNVPINFAFSWVFALLAGNSSIVRLPSREFAQVTWLLDKIDKVLLNHAKIKERSCFVRYATDSNVSAILSLACNARIIWGGDRTVAALSLLPKQPRCVDVVFPDRYSIALLDATAVANSTDEQLKRLAQGFYNDTYLMDQNACSSPHMLFWYTTSDDASMLAKAKAGFWQAVKAYASQHYNLQAQVVVDKYVHLCEDIIDGHVKAPKNETLSFDALMQVNELVVLPNSLTELRGLGGYFYQHEIRDIAKLAPFITESYQTLVYYGIDKLALQQFVVENGLSGIDRIVPFGQALDIDIVWDGYDLVSMLSRIVDIR
ncbi:MAG: hypothetical protein LBG97_00630 [Coriobacteriales bacterium]|jgi:hypothetical protein|nr:hypothetical protein [Coriobacteriales bacterium]